MSQLFPPTETPPFVLEERRHVDPTDHRGWRLPLPDARPNNANALVLASSAVVSSGPSRLHGFTVYSSNAGAQFVLVFDAVSLPADDAVPTLVLPVGATSTVSVYYGSVGRWFDRGIVLCNSSTDVTKTIGVADCLFDAQWE